MRVYLRTGRDETDNVRSLHDWLSHESGIVELRYADRSTSGTMGVDLDVLTLVLSSAFSAAQLVLSIAEWRRSVPHAPAVSIVKRSPDGEVVVIGTTHPDELAEAVRVLGGE